jgi:hypothetical protein
MDAGADATVSLTPDARLNRQDRWDEVVRSVDDAPRSDKKKCESGVRWPSAGAGDRAESERIAPIRVGHPVAHRTHWGPRPRERLAIEPQIGGRC